LHSHRIGVGGVQLLEVEDHLEGKEKPFHCPAKRIKGHNVLGAEMTWIHVVGESFVGLPTVFEHDESQLHGGAFASSLYQPVLHQALFAPSSTQSLDFPDRGALRISDQAEAPIRLETTKNLNRTVQAVRQDQGALSKAVDGCQCSGELGGRGIHFEPHLRSNPSKEIVNRKKTTGEHHPLLGAQDLQPS